MFSLYMCVYINDFSMFTSVFKGNSFSYLEISYRCNTEYLGDVYSRTKIFSDPCAVQCSAESLHGISHAQLKISYNNYSLLICCSILG